MDRLPVKYKGKTLMPMKASRIRRFVRDGKAKIRFDRKIKQYWVQLLVEPSDKHTQEITLGIDPGSTFDGFSVVSQDTHHCNYELIQRPKKGRNSIKSFKKRQSTNRRTRRSRKWHRKIRFDNRTKNKLAPTIKANVDFRKWLIIKLLQYYPISKIVIEDVRFNHYKSKKGSSFSLVEQGKIVLYDWIENLGIELEKYDGFNTKKLRVNSFDFDPKISGLKEKGNKDFNTHCIDSFVLACNKEFLENDEPVITFKKDINKKVIFIEKIVKQRRRLFLTRKRYRDYKFYFRYKKNGVKEHFVNRSRKQNVCRVKPEGIHSNHPKKWIYIDNGYSEKFKSNAAPYGGTTLKGHKFFVNNEWMNRLKE